MLFDLGSAHSYVSLYLASQFSEPFMRLDSLFWVGNPMGQSLMVQLVFKLCVISICGIGTLVDLMLLKIVDFDDILDIN